MLSFSLHSPYILVPKPRREDPPLQLGGPLSRAHFRWYPPLDIAEKLRGAPGWDTCFAGLTFTHQPTFHPLVTGWVKSHSLGSSLSLALFPRPSLGGRIPMALGPLALCPIWVWNRGWPFQSRLLLLSEKVLRTGTPFLSDLPPHFPLPLSNLPQREILNPSPQNLLL